MDSSNNNNNNTNMSVDSPSVYLSFDADSTMGSGVFKAMNDGTFAEEHRESNAFNASKVQTMKRNDAAKPSPLGAAFAKNKNVLRGYNSHCSTPTKAQLLRSVELGRGSDMKDAPELADLGMSFLRMADEEKEPATILTAQSNEIEENKENEEGSTLCVSSSMDLVTSLIENKLHITSERQTVVTEEIIKIDTEEQKIVQQAMETVNTKADIVAPVIKSAPKDKTKLQSKLQAQLKARKTICLPDLLNNRPSRIRPSLNKKSSPRLEAGTSTFSTELSKMASKVCEITKAAAANSSLNSISTAVTQTAFGVGKGAVNAAKSMIDGPMVSTGAVKKVAFGGVTSTNGKEKTGPNSKTSRKSSVPIIKSRPTLLPPVNAGEKRPLSYVRRMSTVLRTTLNSPARKIARRSTYMISNTIQTRRSTMASASGAGNGTASRRSVAAKQPPMRRSTMTTVAEGASRKSVLPSASVTSQSNIFKLPTNITAALRNKQRHTLVAPHNSAPAAVPSRPAPSSVPTRTAPSSVPTRTAPAVPLFKSATGTFICSVCSAKFSIKSLYDAHKRSHEGDGPPTFCKKPSFSAPAAAMVSNASQSNSMNQCKYCDKKFALVRALHIHLLQNCAKIPPNEKRKLQFTEMDHVGKAQLPTFSIHSANDSNGSKKLQKSSSNLSSATASSLDSSNEKSSGNDLLSALTDTQMAPPSSTKVKKNVAHSGIYRTPNKNVPCNECKLSFKSVLDFTNHSLEVHSTPSRSVACLSEASDSSSISNSSNASTVAERKEKD